MNRKLINSKMIVVLAVLLVLFMAVGHAEEERTYRSGQWEYVVTDGSVKIVGYMYKEGSSGNLAIPGELEGYPVTGFGAAVFCERGDITSVTIPDGITDTGYGLFIDCFALTSVSIPASVTRIGTDAFKGCVSLTSVIIPSSVTSIGKEAFSGCRSLASVTILEGITSIEHQVFAYCTGLTSMTIPDGVTRIDDGAFGFSGLTSVFIPGSVTEIGAMNPFEGCPLMSIHVAENNSAYTQIDGVLYEKKGNKLLAYPGAREGGFVIPEDVSAISDSAFSYCTGLTSVTIPDSVTIIGGWAFIGCTSLTTVIIPASVTDIGRGAFSRCEELTLSVTKGSYAEQYAQDNNIPYALATE